MSDVDMQMLYDHNAVEDRGSTARRDRWLDSASA